MKNMAISFLVTLSLVLGMPAFAQNGPSTPAIQGKSRVEIEVEFMHARNAIAGAELASKELLAAKIDLDTFKMKQDGLRTDEIFLLQAKIRGAEANLVASGGFIGIELAKDKNRLETLLLNLATKESIEKELGYKVAYDLALTQEVQRAKDRLQVLENNIVPPGSAAYRVREQKLLDQTMTAELRQARSRVEALKKDARSKIPEADKADRHAKDVAAAVDNVAFQ